MPTHWVLDASYHRHHHPPTTAVIAAVATAVLVALLLHTHTHTQPPTSSSLVSPLLSFEQVPVRNNGAIGEFLFAVCSVSSSLFSLFFLLFCFGTDSLIALRHDDPRLPETAPSPARLPLAFLCSCCVSCYTTRRAPNSQ